MADERDSRRDRRLDEVDELLAGVFADEPVPRLSPSFETRLERRLAEEGLSAAGRRPLPARDRWLLRAYWLLAAAASLAVLATTGADVPWRAAWPALLPLAVTAAGLAVPVLALRSAGGSLLGLLRRALTAS